MEEISDKAYSKPQLHLDVQEREKEEGIIIVVVVYPMIITTFPGKKSIN